MKSMQAQTLPVHIEEDLQYSIKYKYGVVVMKAGTAHYQNYTTTYNHNPALKSFLSFRTNSFFDKIVTVRDTMTSYSELPDLTPLYHNRIVHEGNYQYVEEMWIREHGNFYTELNVKRANSKEVKFDTIVSARNRGYDMLNVLLYIRTLNYAALEPGATHMIATFWGNKKINLIIRYKNRETLEWHGSKQPAYHLTADIVDDAFTEAKNAMEAWIGSDANRTPLKLKAKLKIGTAEAELTSGQ